MACFDRAEQEDEKSNMRDDFIEDNIAELQRDFIDINYDKWKIFCDEEFNKWIEDKK
jgi:hypothetical protein